MIFFCFVFLFVFLFVFFFVFFFFFFVFLVCFNLFVLICLKILLVVSAMQCIDIGEVPFEKAVNAFSNPMTALSFIDIANNAGCKTSKNNVLHCVSFGVFFFLFFRNHSQISFLQQQLCTRRRRLQSALCSFATANVSACNDKNVFLSLYFPFSILLIFLIFDFKK